MEIEQLGLVVHPRRDIGGALDTIRDWASTHGAAFGQVAIHGQQRHVAEPVDAASCDLMISLGGDGTALASLHAAAPASRPVLAVACGSIGVLSAVSVDGLGPALDRVAADDWKPHGLPALVVGTQIGDLGVALNDFVAIRAGAGQVIISITIDGELYARTAGDGLVISTPLGSTAYTMAAGGPILGPGADGFVLVPLATHGGLAPPLVVGPDSNIGLSVEPGYGGGRFELDGQGFPTRAAMVTISQQPDYTTLVTFADQEPLFTSLRRRGLLTDSPRIMVRDARGQPR
jgi:NAD+ kinase